MQPFILIRNFLLKIDCILSIDPAYLVVLCEEELVVIDLVTKEAGWDKALHVIKYLNTIFIDIKKTFGICL